MNLRIGLPVPPIVQLPLSLILVNSKHPGITGSPPHGIHPRVSPIIQTLIVIEHRVDTRH